MKNKKNILIFLFILGLFFYGIWFFVEKQMVQGTIFPQYSSLRTDPLGTSIFYEAFSKMPGFSVDRAYLPFEWVKKQDETTYIYLGIKPWFLSQSYEKEIENWEDFVTKGGRLVFVILPEESLKFWKISSLGREASPSQYYDESKFVLANKYLPQRWGIAFEKTHIICKKKCQATSDIITGDSKNISDKTSLSFYPLKKVDSKVKWEIIYRDENKPVVIEGRLGKGSIVLSSYSYFVSNEAMLKDRKPRLLTWMAGNNSHLIFDEEHHQIQSNPGIAMLARKFDLQWLGLGLVILAGFFVWRQVSPLVPLSTVEKERIKAKGEDSFSGLVDLLRTHISRSKVVDVCFAEWKKTFLRNPRYQSKIYKLDEYNKTKDSKKHPLDEYKAMAQLLKN